ncbi:carboxymuconolactone decarboxylase family protein [Polymorphobacter sp.]|uniref:carboxymuconolactone decarboxylase family protein n=1 Tax=Polymorphobacter sp. TaxID=1909290 RepID=UPI003F6FB408
MCRFPALADTALNDDQRAMAAVAGHGGPYQAFLRAPRLWQALQATRQYLATAASLSAPAREAVMLAVARHWHSSAAFAAHVPLARAAGLADADIEALEQGREMPSADAAVRAAVMAASALLARHGLDEGEFAAACDSLGEAGVVELVGLIGFFSTISLVLNVSGNIGEVSFRTAPGAYSPAE